LILFTFTIFQGVAGWILSSNGTFTGVNDKTLVPELINLLSGSTPWLVALLAVCALAAMQSTGAAYMSTFSGMITRDVYKRYIKPDASESAQKLCGRIFVVIVALAALVVASFAKDALVMLGGLAVAYGFQMFPALMGACYFPWLSRRGIAIGLVAGLLGVTLTDNTVTWFAWLGVPWGKYPLTIHSAGWGILFNLLFTIGGSFLLPDDAATRESRAKRSRFLGELTAVAPEKQKFKWLGLGLVLVWFLVGFGPFATIGNTLFSDPNLPETWGPFGLPSLWVWQLLMLAFGVFVMWFLAFFLGFSKPVTPEAVMAAKRKHYPESQ
jgi:MFS family permease